MPEVGIQGFGARDAQHHRAQDDEGHTGLAPDEAQRVVRTQRRKNFRMAEDLPYTQHRQAGKPQQRDRAEELANACRAALLHREQRQQHQQRQRQHELAKVRRHHLEAFDRRQHRDGRRDDAITIEQRSAEDAYRQQHGAQPGLVLDRLRGQGQHCHQPTFAIVVGAQHQRDVLQRDDQRERPEQDGQHTIHIGMGERYMAGAKDFLDGVQHAGAYIAVHHSNCTQGECCQRGFWIVH